MGVEEKNVDTEEKKECKMFILGCIIGIISFITGSIITIIAIYFLSNTFCLQELIVISPLLLFIFMISILCFWLRDYDFSKALSENWPSSYEKNELYKSSSRVIAFFSGVTAIIIAITVTSAYLYKILIAKDTSNLQLDQFTKFIASLGIGIIPYITNKVVTGKKK